MSGVARPSVLSRLRAMPPLRSSRTGRVFVTVHPAHRVGVREGGAGGRAESGEKRCLVELGVRRRSQSGEQAVERFCDFPLHRRQETVCAEVLLQALIQSRQGDDQEPAVQRGDVRRVEHSHYRRNPVVDWSSLAGRGAGLPRELSAAARPVFTVPLEQRAYDVPGGHARLRTETAGDTLDRRRVCYRFDGAFHEALDPSALLSHTRELEQAETEIPVKAIVAVRGLKLPTQAQLEKIV